MRLRSSPATGTWRSVNPPEAERVTALPADGSELQGRPCDPAVRSGSGTSVSFYRIPGTPEHAHE